MEQKAIEGHVDEWVEAVKFIDNNCTKDNLLLLVPYTDVAKYFKIRNSFRNVTRNDRDELKRDCKDLDKLVERLFKKGERDYSRYLRTCCNLFKEFYLNASDADYSLFQKCLMKKGWSPDKQKQDDNSRKQQEEENRRRQEEQRGREEEQRRKNQREEEEIREWQRQQKENQERIIKYNKKKKKDKLVKWGAALFIILPVILCVWQYVYVPYTIDKNAPRYYTFTNLNLRASTIGDVEYNRIATLPYGSELITYSIDTEWANVKANNNKGFVASNLILPSEDFHLLNSAWGNSDAKECVFTAKCRLALLDYYKRCNLQGGIEWQIYTKGKDMKPNNVFFPRISNKNSKFTDFAFIIKNNQTKKRMLALYSFNDETEAPLFCYDMEAPAEGEIKGMTGYWKNSSLKVTVSFTGESRTAYVAQAPISTTPTPPTLPAESSSNTPDLNTASLDDLSPEELNRKGDECYDRKEYKSALKYYKLSASTGYIEAKANIGWMYNRGLGVPADGTIALTYYKEAADAGNINAHYYLGCIYEFGVNGRFKDQTLSMKYYQLAADNGQKDAITALSRLKEGSAQ